MWHAFAQLLPIAIVAAISVVPIMATIVILVSDKRTQSAFPYATGWVVGTAVLVTLTTVAAAFLPEGRARHRDQVIGAVEIVIGVALIVLGVVSLVRQRSASARQVPGWMNRVDSLDALPAFGLGLALNARPKAFLLAVAAGLVLHTASLAAQADVLGIAFFTVVATSTVVIPVLLTLLSPTRMQPRLHAAHARLGTVGPAVTAVAMIAVGVIILVIGVRNL